MDAGYWMLDMDGALRYSVAKRSSYLN